jgi:hypothetical protein
MRIVDCVQRSPEWKAVRLGIPTASQFKRIITPAKGELSASAPAYIHELIAERIGSIQEEWEGTEDMQNGVRLEPEARAWFAFDRDVDVREVGFVLSDCGRFGASPDGLFNDDTEGLEVKCPKLSTHLGYLNAGVLPLEYKPQVHGGLAVSGLARWHFVSYSPEKEKLVVAVEPDAYTAKVAKALEEFWVMYQEISERLGVPMPEGVPA